MSKRRRKRLPREPFSATIKGLTHDGRGITHINGKTTFIDGALPNEEVKFIYFATHGSYDEGYISEIIKPSLNRVTPKCKHFMNCGGCSLQHIPAKMQLELKQKTLLEQFKHFGEIEPEIILPPLTGPTWGYRRKARLSVKYVEKKGGVLVGFREKRSSYVAVITSCEVLHPDAAQLIEPLKVLIASLELYKEIPQIEIAVDDNRVALVIRHLQPFSDLDADLLEKFAKEHQLYLYLQPHGLDSISLFYPQDCSPLLTYTIPKNKNETIEFKFMPTDFSQVNFDINQKMIEQAIKLLDPQHDEQLLDLFCGIGNFTLPLAQHCAKVTGVEGSEISIARAQLNVKHNSISNTDFYIFDLTKDFSNEPWANKHYDKLLLDPPRSGALSIVEQIEKFDGLKRIVYISCNPATLARDAGILGNKGFKLTMAGVMDMFPHTTHVESIGVFDK